MAGFFPIGSLGYAAVDGQLQELGTSDCGLGLSWMWLEGGELRIFPQMAVSSCSGRAPALAV